MYTTTSVLSVISLALLPQLVAASQPPDYTSSGYTLKWYANFVGDAGSQPSSDLWNIITGDLGVNGELETYSSSSSNVQRSGGETLQLVPWRDSSATNGWTSGRIESKYTFTPDQDAKTVAEAKIRFGSSTQAQKQGIWPAFWLLGEALRQGGSWPACGELDIMEMVDGYLTGYGTAHCDVTPGGLCDETTGLSGNTAVSDYDWHTWRIIWDNTPGTAGWEQQTITWYLDGVAYHTITGSQFSSDHAVWITLAHSAMYFVLNVAVGGSWPGSPTSATLDGYNNMMEVDYVAHYIQS